MAFETAILPAVIETILLETDFPDLVLARDIVGTQYLCCFTARDNDGDRFLAIPISSARLAKLRCGEIDLRSVLLDSETGRHFDGRFRRADGRPTIHLRPIDDVPREWLPEQGFFLSELVGHVEDVAVVRDAIARRAAVVVCQFNPPEARGGVARIDADHLAEGIKGFQALVKYAHKRRLSSLPASIRRSFSPDAYVLRAFATSEGSFKVHFESKHTANLLGFSPVGEAMAKVDELMGIVEVPAERQLEVLRENRGHVVAALQRLLRFISQEKSGLEYRWADPRMESSAGKRVSPVAADAVCAVLRHRQELTVEEVRFSGSFIRVAEDRKTWRAHDQELKRDRWGVVHEGSPNVLQGVVMTDKRYGFVCDERIEETATGTLVPKLFLKSITPTA